MLFLVGVQVVASLLLTVFAWFGVTHYIEASEEQEEALKDAKWFRFIIGISLLYILTTSVIIGLNYL